MNAVSGSKVLLIGFAVVLTVGLSQAAKTTKGNKLNVKSRIVGGLVAVDSYPYVVSIKIHTIFGLYHHFGGSIINHRTVLTAAHCLVDTKPALLKVHVGDKSTIVVYGKLFDVQDTHSHPKWTEATQDYDVGLIRIIGTLTYSHTVQPIKLAQPNATKLKEGDYATVLGWGYTSPSGPPSVELRVAKVPIVNRATCNRQLDGMITSRMICAGFKRGGVDACQMDSGGPLVANSQLIGIVSWGVGCAQPNKPGVYASVTKLLFWIESTLFKEYKEKL